MTLSTEHPDRPIIHESAAAVATRLHALGLDSETLLEVVRYAYGYAAECTTHDPPSAGGFLLWEKGIRRLRDLLRPRGWCPITEQNYPTTVHPDGTLAISVAGGDSWTGVNGRIQPSTRNQKGTVTQAVIRRNQLSFWDAHRAQEPTRKRTWLLLISVDDHAEAVRCELSLPWGLGPDERVSTWIERIILPCIPYDSVPVRSVGDDDRYPSREVDVVRRVS